MSKDMYLLSSFNKVINDNNKKFYFNTITKRQVIYSDFLVSSMDFFLSQSLDYTETRIEDKISQIITAELLYKGIIIPVSEKENEIEYLNSIVNFFSGISTTFFKSKNITEGELIISTNITHNSDRIIFCGIPFDFGSTKPGTRYGPRILREESSNMLFRGSDGFLFDISESKNIFFNKEIYDIGDINLPLNLKSQSLKKIQYLSCKLFEFGIPIFIGGDHLYTLPIIEGLYSYRQSPFTIVQMDYHLDIQLWGAFKNNKPIILTEPTHANFISWINHRIPDLSIFQVGVCNYQSIPENIDNADVCNYLKSIGIQLSNLEIAAYGWEKLLNKLPINQDIYLTIDIDVLNCIYIPNTGHASPLGISIIDFYKIIKYICKNNNLIGVDIMEFGNNDYLEKQAPKAEIVLNIILEIIKSI